MHAKKKSPFLGRSKTYLWTLSNTLFHSTQSFFKNMFGGIKDGGFRMLVWTNGNIDFLRYVNSIVGRLSFSEYTIICGVYKHNYSFMFSSLLSWTSKSPNGDTYSVCSLINPFPSQLWRMPIKAIFNTQPYCASSLPLQREFWLRLQLAFLLNLMRSPAGITPLDSGFTVRSFDIPPPLSSKHHRHRRRIELAICGVFISIWE